MHAYTLRAPRAPSRGSRLLGMPHHSRLVSRCAGELFRPVVARGLFENVVFLATTLVFGSMNVCAYTLELPILLLSTVCRGLLVWPWKALRVIGRSLTGSDGTLRRLHALTGSERSKKL